jgi:hypothetical protein
MSKLEILGIPPERLEIRGKFQVGRVLEPQTVCVNYGRPTRRPNSQLSPLPPFGKGNGRKERSDGTRDQQQSAKVNALVSNHSLAFWGSMQEELGTRRLSVVNSEMKV